MARIVRLGLVMYLLSVCASTMTVQLFQVGSGTEHSVSHGNQDRMLMVLDEPEPLSFSYRGGTIFSGNDLPVYIIWYGEFSEFARSNILDFFASFQPRDQQARPSVSSWWALTRDYKDSRGSSVAFAVAVKQELFNDYSMGRDLAEGHLEGLLGQALLTFPTDSNAFYLILTSQDVYVEGFCTRRCGSHFSTDQYVMTGEDGNVQKVPYAWVGNSATQCPGTCAWPFARGDYGYNTEPLKAPSGDVGVEGMIINIATMLAGTATNPLKNGFFQGHEDLPLEAATACTGVFGQESYPGYPGLLLTDSTTGASFNAYGINNRKYLLPALLSPLTGSCAHPPV